jgi:hypothetical protein
VLLLGQCWGWAGLIETAEPARVPVCVDACFVPLRGVKLYTGVSDRCHSCGREEGEHEAVNAACRMPFPSLPFLLNALVATQ